jgi:transcriptional regulator with XRE-family HTH domain
MKPGQKIKELLKGRGWSATELARRAGVSQQAIDRLLKGRYPVIVRALAVARALGVTPEWLWSEAPWPPKERLAREAADVQLLIGMVKRLGESLDLEIRDPAEKQPAKGRAQKELHLRKE